jgi:hypothetical protein
MLTGPPVVKAAPRFWANTAQVPRTQKAMANILTRLNAVFKCWKGEFLGKSTVHYSNIALKAEEFCAVFVSLRW